MRHLVLFACVVQLILGGTTAAADAKQEPQALAQRAFDKMFNYPSVRSIELDVRRNGKRVSYRAFDVAYQRFEGRGHTILRFTQPDYLRGNAFLIVEDGSGTNDAWLYQPSERRLRRVGTHQKGDPFFGSDLTYEDLEHHDWRRFDVREAGKASVDGVRCDVLDVGTPADSHYRRLRLYVEAARNALLKIQFFGEDRAAPMKEMLIHADQIDEVDGKLVPRVIEIAQVGRDASTLVKINRIEVDPDLTEESFSALRLQRGRDLFSLIPDAVLPPDSP